ncbi:YbjN domain-containing protein [Corynebacterium sp.]|uniref:YbjN domain-containing protein n=1 Tax=Corynebacterium sp. TaxID=1720 RepID=UPI0026DCD60C|nr:YbjN domain-containing protein [Corynebacterium sp.]MDO5075878.1 YbjN domain-containing protein [Corynebacterium sp.]
MKIPTLFDVTLVARSNDVDPIRGKDYIAFAWEDFFTVFYFSEETVGHLLIQSVMYNRLDFSQLHAATQAASTWNLAHVDLTATAKIHDAAASTELGFRTAFPVATGTTQHQLTATIGHACDIAHEASTFFIEQFPSLKCQLTLSEKTALAQQYAAKLAAKAPTLPEHPRRLAEEARFMQRLMSTDDELLEGISMVTLPRIRTMLTELGSTELDIAVDANNLMMSFCNVMFNVSVAPGPALILRGHWVPTSEVGQDFARVFTLCNEWNQSSRTTTAYCSETNSTLPLVNVEYTVAMTRGLSEAQLAQALRVGLSNILTAVEHLSTTGDGASVVTWAN